MSIQIFHPTRRTLNCTWINLSSLWKQQKSYYCTSLKIVAAESWELKYDSKHKNPFTIVPFNEQVNSSKASLSMREQWKLLWTGVLECFVVRTLSGSSSSSFVFFCIVGTKKKFVANLSHFACVLHVRRRGLRL